MVTSTIAMKRSPEANEVRLSDLTDEVLLLRHRDAGDRRAFDELVHRYERELYSYLRRFLGDATWAEDAFQTCFLQVHLKSHLFEEGRKVRPWLYSIATNAAIDSQRRNRRHRMVSLDRRTENDDDGDVGALVELLETSDLQPRSLVEDEEQRSWVREAVQALPETLRTAVNLIYYQGLKYREAADVVQVPVGTMKSRLHAAILKLNKAWRHGHTSADE